MAESGVAIEGGTAKEPERSSGRSDRRELHRAAMVRGVFDRIGNSGIGCAYAGISADRRLGDDDGSGRRAAASTESRDGPSYQVVVDPIARTWEVNAGTSTE